MRSQINTNTGHHSMIGFFRGGWGISFPSVFLPKVLIYILSFQSISAIENGGFLRRSILMSPISFFKIQDQSTNKLFPELNENSEIKQRFSFISSLSRKIFESTLKDSNCVQKQRFFYNERISLAPSTPSPF